MSNKQWDRFIYSLDVKPGKKVEQIDFSILAQDIKGSLNISDIHLQGGSKVTSYEPNTSEMMAPVSFNIDETAFTSTVSGSIKKGTQPVIHQEVTNRFYNIVGRGHQEISIPNVFHEDYTFPVITTALDLSITPKEDFDLLRIRTHDGAMRDELLYPEIPEHPLNKKFTREFFFKGGLEGEEIQLNASSLSASVSGKDYSLSSENLTIGGIDIPITKQRFMRAPEGSFRIGIEFYKLTEQSVTNEWGETTTKTIYKDIGIGYYGIAELKQWSYGGSKL
jgi:hypothetical protein